MSDSCCGAAIDTQFLADARRRRMLIINAAMFVFELAGGLWAASTALQADSLDMLADTLIYGVSLLAITRGPLELILGFAVLTQVIYYIVTPAAPVGIAIMGIAAVALVANLACAGLLLQFRHEDINMRAVWLCTRNDAIGNAGTILAGGLVSLLASKWPDLIIGAALAALLIRTSIGLIRGAGRELRTHGHTATTFG
ncbi:MAG: cation transporter [Salinisphaera sp.]|nr:cation transporter [Salinisphaera sp.]